MTYQSFIIEKYLIDFTITIVDIRQKISQLDISPYFSVQTHLQTLIFYVSDLFVRINSPNDFQLFGIFCLMIFPIVVVTITIPLSYIIFSPISIPLWNPQRMHMGVQ